jgi:PAS domain S-box-containing protein
MEKEIRILIVECSESNLKIILEQLDKGEINYSYLNVGSGNDYIKALTDYVPDIILTDYSMPSFDAITAIELLKDLSPGTPVIIVTSSNDENIVIECMKKGAVDYIQLNNISRLVFAIKVALENKKIKEDKEVYEKKILKLNRTYAVIGQINEMIVRVRDKEKLFEEACNIAVETGKYRLVWVGLVNEKEKIIRPYKWKGIESGFLEEISKMPADYILNNDPIQKSILRGQYFICNNILEEDSGFILRKNGLAHGFHSLISLPLIIRNKVIGSFNIYSIETDFFTEEELKLLVEVAGDISFSLETIENEKAISVSEVKYRRLFESAKEGIIIINSDNGWIIDVNPFIVYNLGYSKEELIGKQFWDIDFIKDSMFNKKSFTELLEYEYLRYEDMPLKKKDGTYMDVEFVSSIFWVDNKKVIQCNIHDISQRKYAEEKLRESEELFRHSFEYAAIGICIVGIDFKFQRINNAFSEMIGFSDDEIMKLTVSDITHPGDIFIGIDNLKRMLEGEIDKSSFEKRYIRKDKRIIWVYVSPSLIRSADHKPQFFITQVIDITERKGMVEDLLKLSRAVEQSPVSILITDLNGNIEYINPKLSEITGYASEEVLGKNPRIFSSGEKPKSEYRILWDTISSGNEWQGEMHNKKKNGDLYWELASISPIVNEKGKIAHYLAVKEDITDRKRVEKELIEAKDKAESANKLKDAFIANISHEIRTPVNGILGLTDLLKDSVRECMKAEDDELFEGIDYSTQRLIRTVDLILNYSRLQVGEYPLFPKIIDLSSICQNLIKAFSAEAKNKSIQLIFQNESEDTAINADEHSITMAISNLLGNAIKFSGRGFIKLILHKSKSGSMILDVIDTGIGISDEYLDKIFEPYRQEQMGYGRAYDGVGLGLALVKKVLYLNNASISVKSKKGEGTAFSINFDTHLNSIEKKIEPFLASEITSVPETNGKKVVLIVEDDTINQMTIIRFIEKYYNVIIANSSEGTMEILDNNKVDLILMDISISGNKNGLDLTKDLKSSREYSQIPVIAITAHAFETDKQNALSSGCDNYLAKPFSRNELLDMINIYLPSP